MAPHVLKIKGHLEDLERLGLKIEQDLAIDIILQSLPEPYDGFVMNYNMHGMNKTVSELHRMLKTAEKNIKTTKDVLMVNKGKGMIRMEKGKCKIKAFRSLSPSPNLHPKQNHLRKEYAFFAMSQVIGKEIVNFIWMI